MSEVDDPGCEAHDPGCEAHDPGCEAHAYFRAIEELFIELRGSPMLLSPADWQIARKWQDRGVPLELVRATLIEVFERRKLRGASDKIQSLKYCANAVESAWQEVRALSHPRRREPPEPLACAERLDRLASSLPAELAQRAQWARRIAELGALEPEIGAQGIEERLAELDRELVASLLEELGDERARLEEQVRQALHPVAGGGGDLEVAARRLLRQRVRRRFGVPVLSLFAPEATG